MTAVGRWWWAIRDNPPRRRTLANEPARAGDRLAGRSRTGRWRHPLPRLRVGRRTGRLARQLDARAGQAAYDAVVAAARLALCGQVDAITTAPLQKEALHRAGHAFPGHTELLASLCGVENFAMMLYLGPDDVLHSPAGLAVVHVTLHTALRNVFRELTEDAVLAKARLADDFMTRLTGSRPRIGICASIRMAAKADCSATKNKRSSRRPSSGERPKGSTSPARCRPTR